MRTPFKSGRAGIRVNLEDQDRAILVQLLHQLDGLLDDGLDDAQQDPLAAIVGMRGTPGPDVPVIPEDPGLARLLPDGNRDDPEASAEYRRLTEYGLRERKRSGAKLAAAALSRSTPIVLTSDEAVTLLKALTDVRLVLGERLELRTDEDAELLHERVWAGEGSDLWRATASIYEVLTAWQEHLIAALVRKK